MITFNSKQVIVVAVDSFRDNAVVHYAEAFGNSSTVRIEDLRATTIQELEDTLTRRQWLLVLASLGYAPV